MRAIFAAFALFICADICATNYYIDGATGSDSERGTTPSAAWRTATRLSDVDLAPGDSVLLCRGSAIKGPLEIRASGTPDKRVVFAAYGPGTERPRVEAPDGAMYAVRVRNSDYVTLRDIEVVNHGSERLAGRTGVAVEAENYGTSRGITLSGLYIHDVNGSLVKEQGGGSGIHINAVMKRRGKPSRFDSLTIENCVIRRCERNAMIWSAPWSRRFTKDFSTNTVVRGNLIEEVPGDGIVPIGCEGALIEYNLMRNCPMTLPSSEAAAGIWPWSCDNTVIRFNEVSDHKAPWDAQGFDSDYNCRNTTIEYNYSHDNDGGFLLVCNSGETPAHLSCGNRGSVVRYNVSDGDAVRQRPARGMMFSPSIHFAGPADSTLLERNVIHAKAKPSADTDRHILTSDSWGGYATRSTFRDNIFWSDEPSAFKLTESTDNLFDGNFYIGTFENKPADMKARPVPAISEEALLSLLRTVEIAGGEALLTTVDKEKIEQFFMKLLSSEP